jgi:hypothetical protein
VRLFRNDTFVQIAGSGSIANAATTVTVNGVAASGGITLVSARPSRSTSQTVLARRATEWRSRQLARRPTAQSRGSI